jgi:putative ABC transport system ATP-binding protein
MIKLENIEKIFRTEEVETVALNSVSLEVKQGEFVAVMGPSGCGKSTLLNILGLLDNPTNGTYVLDGENVIALFFGIARYVVERFTFGEQHF